MEYKITKKIIECEIEVKLSWVELITLVNTLEQTNKFQRGLGPVGHSLRDQLYEAQREMEKGI